jgi:ABC-type branched-subunit amino acid transport system ATPase component
VGLGIGIVPEGRRLFPKQTVEENLLLSAYRTGARAKIAANLEFCFEVGVSEIETADGQVCVLVQ